MLSEWLVLSFSKKTLLIEKSVEQSKSKKECKKEYHKASQLQKFIKHSMQ